MAAPRIVPCIWLDDQAEAAASFYRSAFPDARVDAVARYPRTGDNPSKRPPGSVLTVDLTLAGQRLTLLNGGPAFKPNPSVSFHVHLPDGAAVDALHARLAEGGQELMPLGAYPWSPRYAWLNDRYGVSWQLMARPEGRARPDAPAPAVVPALMFAGPHHGRARAAIAAYVAAFPGSRVRHLEAFGEGEGGDPGSVKQAVLDLQGQTLVAMDGGAFHAFGFDEGATLQAFCADQDEVDRLATALAADGGEEGPCGWVRDRFGLWWQVVPEALTSWLASVDADARDRVFRALLPMRRLHVATLERAFRGERPQVTVEALVRAPLAAVWAAWSDPEAIVRWNAASDDWHTTRARVDLRVGGTFASRMEAKDGSFGFDFEGTYTEVVPRRRLAYAMDDGRACVVTFEPEGDAVRVRETFDAEATNPVELQRQGWQAILDRFVGYVEGRAPGRA